MARNRKLNVLISDEEWEMLQKIAETEGVTASDVVRTLIRKRFRQMVREEEQKS